MSGHRSANGRYKSASERRRTQGSKVRRAQRLALAEAQGWQCAYCLGALTPENVTIDHIVPLSRGGTNSRSNTVAACEGCNVLKRDRVGWQPKIMPEDEGERGDKGAA